MRRRGALTAVLSTLAVLVPPSAALDLHCSASGPGGSWTSVGGSPSSSRVQTQERDLKAPLLPLWTFDPRRSSHVDGQQFVGQPLVDAGCAYVASHIGPDRPGWVYAVNTAHGEPVWQRRLEGGIRSTPALGGGLVVVHVQGRAGPTVVALDRRTGAVRWRTVVAHGGLALTSPLVLGRRVWAGVSGASVLLDLTTGRLLRSTPVAGLSATPAVDAAGRAYLPTQDGLVVVDLSTGRVLAHGPRVATSATPNLVRGKVASVGDDGVLRLLRPSDLSVLSQLPVGVPGSFGATAADGSTVYGSTETPGTVWAVDAGTGSLRWLAPIGDAGHLSPVSVANGVVYTVDLLGHLVAVDAGTGVPVWKVPMALGSETYEEPTLSSAGVTVAQHLVLTASGERETASQSSFVVAYGPARLPV